MKRKTNISVQDNRASRVISNMHVSEEYHGYIPGDILDANMVVKMIYDAIAGLSIEGGDLPTDSVGTEQLKDKSITINDLSDEVVNRINETVDITYTAGEELMEIGKSSSNVNI